METFKNWQEVQLRKEYLRGFMAGRKDYHDCMFVKDHMPFFASDELEHLETLKPCSSCNGSGKKQFTIAMTGSCYTLRDHDEMFFATCDGCGGTGLEP